MQLSTTRRKARAWLPGFLGVLHTVVAHKLRERNALLTIDAIGNDVPVGVEHDCYIIQLQVLVEINLLLLHQSNDAKHENIGNF